MNLNALVMYLTEGGREMFTANTLPELHHFYIFPSSQLDSRGSRGGGIELSLYLSPSLLVCDIGGCGHCLDTL